jgi:hypothetical protein
METSGNQIMPKICYRFYCKKCEYGTSKKSSFENHLQSKKHISGIMETNGNQNYAYLHKNYMCKNCDKLFKNRSGLWKHKQQCLNNSDEKELIPLVLELVKQNSDFKELLVEQNKQNQALQLQFIELAKDKNINNSINMTNNTTNNTTNNNHFNLNLFLNETCKNAMSITEFVEQIPVTINDLEDTARLGYAEGISKIFIKGLKDLEVNERPIHCSDGKRETLYIKEGDIWEKDDSDKTRLTNAIRKVGHKNIRMIPEWKKKYPDCEDYYSNKNDLYLKIVNQSMCGGSEEETETNYNKIRKNIIKEVVIHK